MKINGGEDDPRVPYDESRVENYMMRYSGGRCSVCLEPITDHELEDLVEQVISRVSNGAVHGKCYRRFHGSQINLV